LPSLGSDTGGYREDLALLRAGALAVGPLLRASFGVAVRTWSKGAAGPVTEIDLAVDAQLKELLTNARPDYGWLSEESPDDPARLACKRVFILDPLDGTAAFLKKRPEFCVALAVVENGVPVAGVVYAPITEEVFAAAAGDGATLNGQAISVSDAATVEGCAIFGPKDLFAHPNWNPPWPTMTITSRAALAYRLAGVGAAQADATISLGYKHEWDIAAGALIVAEAGGRITDPFGAPLAFNQPDARVPGVVAAGPALHPLLIERTHKTPHPSLFASQT
jgi:myo-inositol-1(or 4)-monophosphatase